MNSRRFEIGDFVQSGPPTLSLIAAITLALICPISACSRDDYSAEPIEARVVDADSGQPLEGVNVIAAWEMKGGPEGGNIEGYLQVLEAVTDSNGTFRIPGWGPKAKPWYGGFAETVPRIMLFKPGYEYRSVANKRPPQGGSRLLQSDWNGKTITLIRYLGTAAEYKEKLIWLRTHLYGLDMDRSGAWQDMRRFLCAAAHFERRLAAEGAANALPSYEELDRDKGLHCESRAAINTEERK